MSKLKVGVVQATPVLFDLGESLEKARDLVSDYATLGCNFLLFPEVFLPGYPRGLTFGSVVGSRSEEGREQWSEYYQNSLEVPGEQTEILGRIARDSKVFLVIGVSERDHTNGSLYCTLLYFSPRGELLGKHRKIKPTGTERVIWGEGCGDSLTTVKTNFGIIGGLICWENYMPLARAAMYEKGIDLYLAPTADARDTWISTLVHIACEGRCFVLGCNQFVKAGDFPEEYKLPTNNPEDILCRGGSVIISPLGKIIEGPMFDQEGVLIAELDSKELVKSRLDFDPAGHYSRPDIFELKVKDQPGTVDAQSEEP